MLKVGRKRDGTEEEERTEYGREKGRQTSKQKVSTRPTVVMWGMRIEYS